MVILPPIRANHGSLAFVRLHNRFSRYNRLQVHGTSVVRIEMPKWIMRLVPDVPLGAEVWVSGGAPLGSSACFLGRTAYAFVPALKLDGIGSTMVNFPGRSDRRRRV